MPRRNHPDGLIRRLLCIYSNWLRKMGIVWLTTQMQFPFLFSCPQLMQGAMVPVSLANFFLPWPLHLPLWTRFMTPTINHVPFAEISKISSLGLYVWLPFFLLCGHIYQSISKADPYHSNSVLFLTSEPNFIPLLLDLISSFLLLD